MPNRSSDRILIVEDEALAALDMQYLLSDHGYEVLDPVDCGEKAVLIAGEKRPDLILMDIMLSGQMTGISAADIIREQYNIPIVFLTGQSDNRTIDQALTAEPFGYILKPYKDQEILTTIRMALYKAGMERKLRQSEHRYRTIAELADPIFVITEEMNVSFVNSAGARVIHLTPEEIEGKKIDELLSPENTDAIRDDLKTVISTNEVVRTEIILTLPEGPRWFTSILTPLAEGGRDKNRAVLMYLTDITTRKTIELMMADKSLRQIEDNMEKFQILNDKIRNPLQVISLLVNTFDYEKTDDVMKQVEIIDEVINQLDNGWLDSSKVRTFLSKHYSSISSYSSSDGTGS
ncbi:MAG TPA: response regulator [Methanospirillum sp.]|nr:response regulator [Methanospirillum sp.]